MPKIKTHSGLKKRLKRTGSGKLKRSHAYISHLSHNKTHKQKKHLAKATVVSASDYKRIKSRLCNWCKSKRNKRKYYSFKTCTSKFSFTSYNFARIITWFFIRRNCSSRSYIFFFNNILKLNFYTLLKI